MVKNMPSNEENLHTEIKSLEAKVADIEEKISILTQIFKHLHTQVEELKKKNP